MKSRISFWQHIFRAWRRTTNLSDISLKATKSINTTKLKHIFQVVRLFSTFFCFDSEVIFHPFSSSNFPKRSAMSWIFLKIWTPPQKQLLLVVRRQKNLVSCRERWTLFNGNYLSGAILMAADNVGNLRWSIRQVESYMYITCLFRFKRIGMEEDIDVIQWFETIFSIWIWRDMRWCDVIWYDPIWYVTMYFMIYYHWYVIDVMIRVMICVWYSLVLAWRITLT